MLIVCFKGETKKKKAKRKLRNKNNSNNILKKRWT